MQSSTRGGACSTSFQKEKLCFRWRPCTWVVWGSILSDSQNMVVPHSLSLWFPVTKPSSRPISSFNNIGVPFSLLACVTSALALAVTLPPPVTPWPCQQQWPHQQHWPCHKEWLCHYQSYRHPYPNLYIPYTHHLHYPYSDIITCIYCSTGTYHRL